MTRDDIIKLARAVGMNLTPAQFSGVLEADIDEFQLERFAKLVAAVERRRHQADIERWKDAATNR